MKTKIAVIITFIISIAMCWFIEYPILVRLICSAMIIGCYFVFYPIRRNKPFKRSLRPEWCKYQLGGKSVYVGCYELQNDINFTNQICSNCPYGKLYKSKA